MSATQRMDSSLGQTLFMALELGQRTWKLAFSPGLGGKPRIHTMPGSDVGHLALSSADRRTRLWTLKPEWRQPSICVTTSWSILLRLSSSSKTSLCQSYNRSRLLARGIHAGLAPSQTSAATRRSAL